MREQSSGAAKGTLSCIYKSISTVTVVVVVLYNWSNYLPEDVGLVDQ